MQKRLQLNRRLVSLYAFDGGPRDLRFSSQKNKLVRPRFCAACSRAAQTQLVWCV
jgi:hypothetical protein